MLKLRVVGSAFLITLVAPAIGFGAYLVGAPLLISFDAVTGLPHEPEWYGGMCLYVALAVVSAGVGYAVLAPRRYSAGDGLAAGALAGTLLCAVWVFTQLYRGIPLGNLLHWSMPLSVAMAAVCGAMGAFVAAKRDRRRGW